MDDTLESKLSSFKNSIKKLKWRKKQNKTKKTVEWKNLQIFSQNELP